jgi:hypothetical protein
MSTLNPVTYNILFVKAWFEETKKNVSCKFDVNYVLHTSAFNQQKQKINSHEKKLSIENSRYIIL